MRSTAARLNLSLQIASHPFNNYLIIADNPDGTRSRDYRTLLSARLSELINFLRHENKTKSVIVLENLHRLTAISFHFPTFNLDSLDRLIMTVNIIIVVYIIPRTI